MTLEEELAEFRRPEVQALLERNRAVFTAVFTAYSFMGPDQTGGPVGPLGSGVTFNQLLLFGRDFNIVPRLLSMTQLLDLFSAVNITDG